MQTTRYIALLGAVNVGKRQMKMARLREIIADLGFLHVGTYIQTGNLFFDAPSATPAASIKESIEKAMAEEFGFAVDTVLLSIDSFASILDRAPFGSGELGPDERRLIMFLRAQPAAQPGLPLTSDNGSFTIVGADGQAWYMHIADAQTWARTATAQMKKMAIDVPHTGRWRHTSVKILQAARTS